MEQWAVEVEREILDQYLNDRSSRPWIVAFSGGKDSTALLQLVWKSLMAVPPESRLRHVYVVCNNTLVENPKVLQFVEHQLELIRSAAAEQSMPITVTHTTPSLQDTFWVNLIGKGYAAPNSIFRWCTERLKIKPTTRYIQDKVSLHGDVIVLLGTRRAESITRARAIKKYEVKGRRLTKHPLPNTYVYSPLKELSTEQIWWYLATDHPPWGSGHQDLIRIYRNASDDNDCPLITDMSTPPCGRSRFGCWVCTVVASDKTMENLIERGEDWMLPLLSLRNWLARTIDRDDPEYRPEVYRMPVRRNLREGLGPYWPRWRKYILERLLEAEATIRREKPDLRLITRQELAAIQLIWHRDHIYDYDVSRVLDEAYQRDMGLDDIGDNVRAEKLLLKQVCSSHESDYDLLNNLLLAQKNRILLVNRRGIQRDIESILDEHLCQRFANAYRRDRD